MKLNTALFENNQIEWMDNNGKQRSATIGAHIRDGATSAVFRAFSLPTGTPDHSEKLAINRTPDFIIKVPFPDAVESKFVDEVFVIDQLRQKFEGISLPLPQAYQTRFDNSPVTVMEYFEIEDQVSSRRQVDPDFHKSGYISFALQSLDLFITLHNLGLANQDVKIENFYWRGQKLVVLDWNRCIQDNQSDPTRHKEFLNTIHETYITLSSIWYQVYTGKEPPNPLPFDLEMGWGHCPRILKRTMVDCRKKVGISPLTIQARLKWLEKTIQYEVQGDYQELFVECAEIHESNSTSLDLMERAELVWDAMDAIPDYALQLKKEEEESWARKTVLDQLVLLENTEEQVRKHLLNFNLEEAANLCLERLELLQVPRKRLWHLARLYICARALNDLRGDKFNVVDKGLVPAILTACAEGNANSSDALAEIASANDYIRKSVENLVALLQQAEALKQNMVESQSLPKASDRLEKLDEIEEKITSIRKDLPQEVYAILIEFMPLWDRAVLKSEVERQNGQRQDLQQRQSLKEEIVDLVKTSSDFRKTLLNVSDKICSSEGALDEELRQTDRALQEVIQNEYANAIRLLKVGYENAEASDFVYKILNLILKVAGDWLTGLNNVILYQDDIRRANELLGMDDGFKVKNPELAARLDLAQKAEPKNAEMLAQCKVKCLEPWSQSKTDLSLSTDSLLRLIHLEKTRNDLAELLTHVESDKVELKAALYTPEQLAEIQEEVKEFTAREQAIDSQAQAAKNANKHITILKDFIAESSDGLEQKLVDVTAKSNERLGALRYQKKLADDSVEFLKKETITNQQIVAWQHEINLVIAIALDCFREQRIEEGYHVMEEALKSWQNLSQPPINQEVGSDQKTQSLMRQDTSYDPAIVILQRWISHFREICANQPLRDQYSKWFTILSQKNVDVAASLDLLKNLAAEKGKPLYEYLYVSHSVQIYGNVEGMESRWWNMFKGHKIEELRREIKLYKPINSYEEKILDEWHLRMYQFDIVLYIHRLPPNKKKEYENELQRYRITISPTILRVAEEVSKKP